MYDKHSYFIFQLLIFLTITLSILHLCVHEYPVTLYSSEQLNVQQAYSANKTREDLYAPKTS